VTERMRLVHRYCAYKTKGFGGRVWLIADQTRVNGLRKEKGSETWPAHL
jgi:hypothetical protein